LFPEITVSAIGHDHMRAGEPKLAVKILKLVLLAYPDSADAHETSPKRVWRTDRKIWHGNMPKGTCYLEFSCRTSVLMDQYRAIPR
jgi:hypothetical protein